MNDLVCGAREDHARVLTHGLLIDGELERCGRRVCQVDGRVGREAREAGTCARDKTGAARWQRCGCGCGGRCGRGDRGVDALPLHEEAPVNVTAYVREAFGREACSRI